LVVELILPLHRQRYSHSKQASIRHAKELNDRYSAQGKLKKPIHFNVS
jgi:hypothetical protein